MKSLINLLVGAQAQRTERQSGETNCA
uniref:Uncharacterized protein n=1 Tax=Anguilla anguilla TaxID=7936 RepID=A0A0E9S1J3_ANGAN